jgi:hypothetical protein
MFRDISGLLAAPKERELAYDLLADHYKGKGITAVAGMVRIVNMFKKLTQLGCTWIHFWNCFSCSFKYSIHHDS